MQLAGALLAAWFLEAVIHVSASYGSSYPAASHSPLDAFLLETVLTLGLVSVILGTASGAQQVGLFGAIGVGGYIALAGLWASPISGASMNPARTLGPDLVSRDLTSWWVYLAAPLLGAVLAVGVAFLLRGPGGGKTGSLAAQGSIKPLISRPDQTRPDLTGPGPTRPDPVTPDGADRGSFARNGRYLGVGQQVRPFSHRPACRGHGHARWSDRLGPRPDPQCRRVAVRH